MIDLFTRHEGEAKSDIHVFNGLQYCFLTVYFFSLSDSVESVGISPDFYSGSYFVYEISL